MEQENYYLLLELQVDPPEEDPKVIVKALKEKQAQWSRYRNHPTKAIQAKRYIGLIPDIKKVMSDPKLRKQEAAKARKILIERDQEQFVQIDNYIKLLIIKDGISQEVLEKLISAKSLDEQKTREWVTKRQPFFLLRRDIQHQLKQEKLEPKIVESLCKKHGVEPEAVQELAEAVHREKITEIDKYLAIRIRRGYITEQTIIDLANTYQIDEDFINRRVKCPIRKKADKKNENLQGLDPAIENTINDNLQILGKSSLYDFLGVVPSTSLENLQKRAKEKEMEVRNISQKTAAATAGSILAGQCISIFKSEESRSAYEITLSRSQLSSLDEKLRVAALNNPIPSDACLILLKSALQIGLTPEEARDYIQTYAHQENITIEMPAKKKKKSINLSLPPKQLKIAAAVGGFILIIAAFFLFKLFFTDSVEQQYQDAMVKIQRTQKLEDKIKILEQFLKNQKPSQYTTMARREMRKFQDVLDEQNFVSLNQAGNTLINEARLEEALNIYHEFIKNHPRNKHVDEVRNMMRNTEELIDERDFKEAVSSDVHDVVTIIDKHHYYLEMHPDGKFEKTVRERLAKIIASHFARLQKELATFESQRDWETGIRIVSFFIEKYRDDPHALELRRIRAGYENNQRFDNEIASLDRRAENLGENFNAAIAVYEDYLKVNPEISNVMRDTIQGKINEIQRRQRIFLNQEKEWEDLKAFVANAGNEITARISRLETYIQRNPGIRFFDEAGSILQALQEEKEKQDQTLATQREDAAWNKLLTDVRNQNLSLANRIDRTNAFIRQYGGGKYGREAQTLLQRLTQEKQAEDERIRIAAATKKMREQEIARIRSSLAKTRGRFVDNGDGTVKDTRTGLIWTLIDSSTDIGQCLNYYAAAEYVKELNTGGYRDWRLPSADELFGIYKTEPFFPQGNTPWYWSINVIVKGWNKVAHIVTTKPESDWNRIEADLDQCGAVRAVRN